METLYDWLLHHMGNEANYFTILNVQRQTDAEYPASLEVMVRTKEFERLNLFIQSVVEANTPATGPEAVQDQPVKASYLFKDKDQVIAYLSGAKRPNQPLMLGCRVFVCLFWSPQTIRLVLLSRLSRSIL